MRRREFIELFGGALMAWPLPAQAQRGKILRIGIIDNAPVWDDFRKGMRDLGYVEGQSIAYEYRSTDGTPGQLAQAAAELVRIPVDLIATFGTPASKAAKQATTTIPIVMVSIGDPIGSGLVPSIARPGGNLTGNTILGTEMAAKRVQLLKEVLPNTSRVAFLRNPDNASNALILEELRNAAKTAGVTVITVDVHNVDEFDGALTGMMTQHPDVMMATNDPLQQLNMPRIIDFLARHKLPGMFQARENVIAGGLMSYGANLPDLFKRAAGYAHRILTGTKPSDLPVEQPTIFELVVNLKTAKALGLTIPESFLLRTDEVIE
jgi:putative tryptophan/tyrosine transport system substrate-binding protein